MSLYVITRVRVDADGWLVEATWQEADGQYNRRKGEPKVVGADEIGNAIDRGDNVELIASSPAGTLIANEMMRREMRNGRNAIKILPQEDRAQFFVDRY
jgi:hypothetical protein